MLPLLIIPLLAAGFSQTIKLTFEFVRTARLSWRSLDSYGGMPSAHTAMVISLMTVIGLSDGVASAHFAIASIFALIVIRDAIGIRRYLGWHSKALNQLVKDLPKSEQGQFVHFREKMGHTPLEAFVGAIIGFAVSAIFYPIM